MGQAEHGHGTAERDDLGQQEREVGRVDQVPGAHWVVQVAVVLDRESGLGGAGSLAVGHLVHVSTTSCNMPNYLPISPPLYKTILTLQNRALPCVLVLLDLVGYLEFQQLGLDFWVLLQCFLPGLLFCRPDFFPVADLNAVVVE